MAEHEGPDLYPDGSVDGAVERWLAEVRVDAAARERAAVAGLRALAAEEATLAGVLVDLATRGEAVSLVMRSGKQHRGHVRLVAPDAVVVALETRQWLVARLAAVAALRTVQSPPVPGEAEPSTLTRFVRIASALAAPGDWVVITSGASTFGGTMESAGEDVVVLRLDNGDRAYVALADADELSLSPAL